MKNKNFEIIIGTMKEVAERLQELIEGGWTLNGELFKTGKRIDNQIEVAHAVERNKGNVEFALASDQQPAQGQPGQKNSEGPMTLPDAKIQSSASEDVVYDFASGRYKQLPAHIIDRMMAQRSLSNKVN